MKATVALVHCHQGCCSPFERKEKALSKAIPELGTSVSQARGAGPNRRREGPARAGLLPAQPSSERPGRGRGGLPGQAWPRACVCMWMVRWWFRLKARPHCGHW